MLSQDRLGGDACLKFVAVLSTTCLKQHPAQDGQPVLQPSCCMVRRMLYHACSIQDASGTWHLPLGDAASKAGSDRLRLHNQVAVLTVPGCMPEQVPCFCADIVTKLAEGLI